MGHKAKSSLSVYQDRGRGGWGGAPLWLHSALPSNPHKFDLLFFCLVISETLPRCLKRTSTRTTSSWVDFTASLNILSTYIGVRHVECELCVYLSVIFWRSVSVPASGSLGEQTGRQLEGLNVIEPISSQNADRAALVDLVDETGKIELFSLLWGFFPHPLYASRNL